MAGYTMLKKILCELYGKIDSCLTPYQSPGHTVRNPNFVYELVLYIIILLFFFHFLCAVASFVTFLRGRVNGVVAATFLGNLWLLKFFLSIGADVNVKWDITRLTALHRACLINNEQMISLLIQKGADIGAQTNLGKTPFSMLNPAWEHNDSCLKIMVKELTKLVFGNVPLRGGDKKLLKKKPNAREHFKNCLKELIQMSRTKFHGPYSYYSVLCMGKSINKLAHLTKNVKFVENFEKNLWKISYYESDLRSILQEAIRARDKSLIVTSRLYLAFGDFIPDTMIRLLAENLTDKDLPLRKTIFTKIWAFISSYYVYYLGHFRLPRFFELLFCVLFTNYFRFAMLLKHH